MNWYEVFGNGVEAADVVTDACQGLVTKGVVAEYLREQYEKLADENLDWDDEDEQDFDELAEQVLNEWYESLAEQMFAEIYDSDDIRLQADRVNEMVEWLKAGDVQSHVTLDSLVAEWLEYDKEEEEEN